MHYIIGNVCRGVWIPSKIALFANSPNEMNLWNLIQCQIHWQIRIGIVLECRSRAGWSSDDARRQSYGELPFCSYHTGVFTLMYIGLMDCMFYLGIAARDDLRMRFHRVFIDFPWTYCWSEDTSVSLSVLDWWCVDVCVLLQIRAEWRYLRRTWVTALFIWCAWHRLFA